LSNKRRQQQEHFAGSALSDSNLKQEVVDDSSVNGGKYDMFESIHGKVYSIQHYLKKFVSDLRQVGGFLWALQFRPSIKLTATI
jgi:hypothetical protein